MPEKIEFIDERWTVVGRFLISSVSEYTKNHPDFKLPPKNPMEVSLIVNGAEIPIKPVLGSLVRQWDEATTQRAEELLRKRVPDLLEALEQLSFHVDDAIADAMKSLAGDES